MTQHEWKGIRHYQKLAERDDWIRSYCHIGCLIAFVSIIGLLIDLI